MYTRSFPSVSGAAGIKRLGGDALITAVHGAVLDRSFYMLNGGAKEVNLYAPGLEVV